MDQDKQGLYIVAIVAIVAVIGIVITIVGIGTPKIQTAANSDQVGNGLCGGAYGTTGCSDGYNTCRSAGGSDSDCQAAQDACLKRCGYYSRPSAS